MFFSDKMKFVMLVTFVLGIYGKCSFAMSVNKQTSLQLLTTTTQVTSEPWMNMRLPTSLLPRHYVVDLQPILTPDEDGLFWFIGSSEATFEVTQATDVIIIHSKKLHYTSISLSAVNGTPSTAFKHWIYEPNQYLVVKLKHAMKKGQQYTLKTEFYGELKLDLKGLYLTTSINSKGEQVPMVSTMMQATEARKVFPCFDEPALKATFDIYLWHKDPYIALASTRVLWTQIEYENWKRTKFERTPPMSTYTLGFSVNQFSYVETFTAQPPQIKMRVYARKDQVNSGNANYAATIAPRLLDYFAEFFNVKYALSKADQLAVNDLPVGAMENWGLIIYVANAVLYDPITSSASDKQSVTITTAHELSHQWFGNLVSPFWWDELWTTEGMASFLENVGMNVVQPSYRAMDQIILSTTHVAMNTDAWSMMSKPIVGRNITTPSQIYASFGDISYQKGGCIYRMIHQIMGDEAFKLGLQNYIKKNAYGSIRYKQLFQQLETTANKTFGIKNPPGGIAVAINTWLLQMGFPTLTVKRNSSNPNQVIVSQERFIFDPQAGSSKFSSPYNYKWIVPFWYIKEGEERKTLMWMGMDSNLTIDVPSHHYIIGNYEVFGYYRVNYDAENWRRIIAKLNSNFTEINVKTRGQLINDAFNLARVGKLDYDTAFNLTTFLRKDFDYVTWKSALDALLHLSRMLRNSNKSLFSSYILYLIQPIYNKLTWNDGGNHLEQLQRANVIETACNFGNLHCVLQAIEKFRRWKENPYSNMISPNLRSTVYCTAIAEGSTEDWEFLWNRYLNEQNPPEKYKLLKGLICTSSPGIVKKFLAYSLKDNYVRRMNFRRVFSSFCSRTNSRDITLRFLQKNWNLLHTMYSTGFTSFYQVIESCIPAVSTEHGLKQLVAFRTLYSKKLGSNMQVYINHVIEKTKVLIQQRVKNEAAIVKWLTKTMKNVEKISPLRRLK